MTFALGLPAFFLAEGGQGLWGEHNMLGTEKVPGATPSIGLESDNRMASNHIPFHLRTNW